MKKQLIKDIATALIAKSGSCFDSFAFDESDLGDEDVEKIVTEINFQCKKMIQKIEKKYKLTLRESTHEIIDDIYYTYYEE